MGLCASKLTEEEKRAQLQSKALDKRMREQEKKDDNINKLLLLGAGESGKSTLFKQMVMIYGTPEERGHPEDQSYRESYIEFVLNNVLTNAQTLALASQEFGEAETEEGKAAALFFQKYSSSASADELLTSLPADTTTHLRNLWKDPGIQRYSYNPLITLIVTLIITLITLIMIISRCYDQRSSYQLNDSTAYFFNQLDIISAADYVPSKDDILRVRIRTTGNPK